MSDIDFHYYARRARQERESAERAKDRLARRLHLELAERYSAMLGDRNAPLETTPFGGVEA